jgi:Uma2 family endonuclease
MATKTLMTVEQFSQMQTADTEDYELVEGELVPLSSATPLHAEIRRLVETSIASYFHKNRVGLVFGEVDCRISDDTVRRPDVSIFLGERVRQIDLTAIPVPFAPDIAVEILSPSESAMHLRRKVLDYLRAGSSEVWLVDSFNREVEIRTISGSRMLAETDLLTSPLLPEFSVPVANLFFSLSV